jgi:hypothetical protein
MKNNKLLYVLVTTLLLSACGSGTNEKEQSNTVNAEAAIAKNVEAVAPKHDVIELVATPIEAKEKLKGHKMESLKDGVSDWQRGRVQFLNLEGGFYGIITDSGNKILPMNLAKEFAQNGAVVRIKGKVKNVMTIQQWGTPFTITEIELITPGNKAHDNEM